MWDLAERKEIHHLLGKTTIAALAFSPDGKTLAGAGRDNRIHLCDVATGKELRNWEAETDLLCFSPDGKFIASSDSEIICVWASDSGKEVMRLHAGVSPFGLAFSPNGRILVAAGLASRTKANGDRDDDSAIQCWDMRTGQMIREFNTQQGLVYAVAFAPDGRTIASDGANSTILLCDLTGHGNTKPAAPSAAELDKLWADLASDAAKSHRALWTLALSPQQSVPFLTTRMCPSAAIDVKQFAGLWAGLENDTFSIRSKAEKSLVELGESAEAALQEKLRGNVSLEVRRRLEQILEKRRPDVLRQLRAIDTLEQIGNPETREILATLVKGAANPRVSQAAEAALQRQGRNPSR